MRHGFDDDLVVKFTPRLSRFLGFETLSYVVGLGGLLAVSYWLGVSTGALFVGVVVGFAMFTATTMFSRRSRGLVIGDTWIQGPGSVGGSTTIRIDMIDWKRSGTRRGHLRIVSLGGDTIDVRATWFSPEELADITRLIRGRTDGQHSLTAAV